LLLALARAGHNEFTHARDPSPAARARLLIAAEPARDWKPADLEAGFAISSATLRRRLQEAHSSFRILLQAARLRLALQLLQTRRQPLKSTAAACGYSSLASFSRAFTLRFGLALGGARARKPGPVPTVKFASLSDCRSSLSERARLCGLDWPYPQPGE
jgi:AraC-like DNA-binding protein